MKNSLLFVFLFSLLISVQAETIEKTYYFSNPNIVEVNEYQQILFGNDLLTAPAGEPAMPYSSVSLLLPPGHIATSIEFIGEGEIALPGSYKLWPYQPSRPLSEESKAEFVKNEKLYSTDVSYPKQQTGRLSTQFLNGHGLAFSTFTPLKYNPARGTISYFTKVTVIIETAPSAKAEKALQNLSSRNGVKQSLKRLAQNPSMISAYPKKSTRSDESYKLLIITPEQFEDDFDELRNIYLSRGVVSKIFTKEYILANVDGQDLPEKIRNLIILEYQESDIEYVLLGGDVEHIPHRGFYCYAESGGGYSDNGIPADLYYSGLDGNWNDNGDDKWAEPDEDDLLPDVAVARFPFSNSTELANLTNKSISYQNSPVLGEFQKPLLAGEHLYSDPETWGKDYLDLLIGEHDDNGYTTIGIPEDYNIETMYEHDAAWNGGDLIDKVNEGKQFIHHVGHASPSYVAYLSTSDITDANFYAANGVDHNYTIMQTHGCDCGSFDNNDCILEKMVLIQNFAVAVVGNSRYGWFNEGQTEGPAAHLHREMVDAMFNDEIAQIGKAFAESKIQTAPWVEAPGQWEEGAMRWNFYDINVLGDPAMSIWNNEPIDINVDYPAEVALGTPSIEVIVSSEGEPLEGFSCAVMKNGQLRANGLTDENGLAVLVFDPLVTQLGDASLIVSGYNCLPDTNAILFIPSGGPYVVYAENIVDDAAGNANGLVDFGEHILLDLSLRNVGSDKALNVNAAMYQENYEWFTITDEEEAYGDITVGDTVMKLQAFAFDVADNIPDQTVLELFIDAFDGNETWTSDFQLIANAPILVSGEIIVDDALSGNGNGQLDPGEILALEIPVSNNGHSDCESAVASISTTSPYVFIEYNTHNLGDLNFGDETNVVFEMEIDEFAPIGSPVEFQLEMTTGAYTFVQSYFMTIGIMREDFETGDFTEFDWINAGNEPWVISSESPYEGAYSAKSGNISDDQSSDLMITLETIGDGEISFYHKVSSEDTWDFLRFYMDGNMLGEWSGEEDWEQSTYDVSQGSHILKWSYEKDQNTAGGSDCGWLDNVVFPATTTIISVNEIIGNNSILVYPNPGNGVFYLSSEFLKDNAKINVYDISGRQILNQINSNNNAIIKLDLSFAERGLYFVEVKAETGSFVEKIIVQ